MRKKIILLITVVFLLFASAWSADQEKSNRFRFVFMTDIHVQLERGGVEGFKAAIKAVNALKPKPAFVVTGGDLIMDALGVSFERADSLYNLYIDMMKYFQMPVYILLLLYL